MIGTLDIYNGVYLHVTIVYMSFQTCTLRVTVKYLSKVSASIIVYNAWEVLQLCRLCCTLEFKS